MTEMEVKRSWRMAPVWMKLLLAASLLGNAAVAGIAGGWMARDDERWPDEPGLSRQQARILHMVPEPRREMAREILLARADEIEAARAEMRAAHEATIAAIRAEPFSPERLEAATAARMAAGRKVFGTAYEQLGEIVAQLSAAERAELAENLDERYQRWMERRGRSR